ncbi:MAG TPA: energy-coupling factor transporter transmembrane component T [Ktedonobacteraceae bacterium]|nr:energy-coupling factor transporter transmembrane component T [Ktedonobacteraceae bacterium]
MFQNIPIGTYYPGNSLLHRLRARTKLLLMLWLTIFFTIANQNFWDFTPHIVALLLLFAGIALAGISPGVIWRRMRWLVLLALIGIIPNVLFFSNSGTKVLRSFGPWPLSYTLVWGIILAYGLAFALFILLSLLPLARIRVVKRNRWFKRVRILLIVLAIVALILWWLTRKNAASSALPIGPIVLTYDGVWAEVTIFVVFLTLFACSILLTMTTSPIALIEGLTRLLSPLRWLRLPVDDFALMLLIALRFIPTLVEEVELLIKAQTSRGADYMHGSARERLQSLIALFVPFISSTLRRASDLAIALDARGFEVQGRPTMLHDTALSAADYMVMGVVAVVTISVLVI